MDEDGEDLSSPFWMPTSSKRRHNNPIRHGISSLFFSSGLLILLLLITAITFLVFVLPSTLNFSAQIFKPISVKKSWDSLNLLLVLFAILFGFLSRNKNDEERISDINDDQFQASPVNRNEYTINDDANRKTNVLELQSPEKWYDYSDHNRMVSSRDGFLRTSTSYPDLRQVSSEMEFPDDPWRFSDDINWATGTGHFLRRRSWKNIKSDDVTGPGTPGTGQRLSRREDKFDDGDGGVNSDNIPVEISSRGVDAFQPVNPLSSPSVIPTPPALPLRSQLPEMTSALPEEKPVVLNRQKRGRSRRKDIEMENVKPISPAVASPPPPPPPMPQFEGHSKSKKKRSGGNATKEFLNSLYHKKTKKQRQKSVENFETLLVHQYQSPSQPPPPPPPPPFKRSTIKRNDAVISAASGPTPSQFLTVAMNLPPNEVLVNNYYGAEESGNSGGESPVVRIPPPPPPPPPFAKSLKWKFALQGDYVRVDSLGSSRSGSPDPDDTESDVTPMAGGASPLTASSAFWPSPDVNSKAENFISNFWAGLKLEKINSMNKRDGLGLSNLGPGSGPTRK